MISSDDRRLDAARRLITHVGEQLQADLAIRLWNGEIVPLGPSPRTDILLAVNSPGAVTRLIRRPRLSTLIELFATGDVAIEGGTLLDVAARRGSLNTKGLFRRLDKRVLLSATIPFLFGAGAAMPASHAYEGAAPDRNEAGRDNQALVRFHYDLSNRFYSLFLGRCPELC
jgi:cyclopropane-fatty-acyl-phospholipid synthase